MSRLGAVLVALAVGTAAAQTRRPDADPGVPLVTRLPGHLGDPATVEELKLSPEQVAALRPKSGKAGAAPDVAKIKAVLSTEQYRRAVQLMAQDALRTGRGAFITPAALVAVPASTLRRYPELADAANLTRDQRRRVARLTAEPMNPGFVGSQPSGYGGLPSAAHIILTPEQSAVLAAFVGPLRATPFAAASDAPAAAPTFTRTTRGPVSPSQRVMTALNNRGELKLTAEQVTTLNGLMNAGRVVARPAGGGDAPPQPPRPTTPADTEAALAKALTAPQMTRLGQIELWQEVPAGADETAKFDIPRVASAVALTPDQKAEVKALCEAHRKHAAKALATAESAAALKSTLAAARAEVAAGVGKVLTPEQATRFRDLFGPEYRGPGGGPGNDVLRRIRVAGYNRYQLELMAVNRLPGVAEDLRLSEEQKTALSAAEADINRQFSQGFDFDLPEDDLAKQLTERSKAVEKALARHLNADQRKRLPGIGIQLRQQLNADRGGGAAAVYPPTGTPGVADALKLTPEQRKRIVETGQEDDVLTPAQRDELKQLAGPPLTGGFNFGGRGGRVVPPSVRVTLLHAGTAHAELKLDAEQARVVAEVIEAHAAELRPPTAGRTGEFGGYVEPPQPDQVEETLRACEKACDSLLTPAQRARLDQLALQAAARESLTAAFARPEVAGSLALTSEQQAALSAIATDYHARVAEVNALPSTPGWAELRSRALTEAREKARERMTAALTDRQRAAWRELTGPPNPAVATADPAAGGRRDP